MAYEVYVDLWTIPDYLWVPYASGDATKCAKPYEVHKARQQIADFIEKVLHHKDTVLIL